MSEQFGLNFDEPEETKVNAKNSPKISKEQRILYFDLETQKSAEDVGGWDYAKLMGLAVGVVWDSLEGEFFGYEEHEATQLVKKLKTADLVIGFNVIKFDYEVLKPYARKAGVTLKEINTFDMLDYIKDKLNHRLSLNHLAENTLNTKKSADVLVSLQWYKEGEIEKIVDYCKQDVKVTRDLFLYGESNDHVKYKKRGIVKNLTVDWKIPSLISPP